MRRLVLLTALFSLFVCGSATAQQDADGDNTRPGADAYTQRVGPAVTFSADDASADVFGILSAVRSRITADETHGVMLAATAPGGEPLAARLVARNDTTVTLGTVAPSASALLNVEGRVYCANVQPLNASLYL